MVMQLTRIWLMMWTLPVQQAAIKVSCTLAGKENSYGFGRTTLQKIKYSLLQSFSSNTACQFSSIPIFNPLKLDTIELKMFYYICI
jgi:hypothetical protein